MFLSPQPLHVSVSADENRISRLRYFSTSLSIMYGIALPVLASFKVQNNLIAENPTLIETCSSLDSYFKIRIHVTT